MTAASVRTRVVSWKDAAARKLDVESLGDAEQDRLSRRGLAARGDRPGVDVLELEAIEELHREKLGVAGLLDADLA